MFHSRGALLPRDSGKSRFIEPKSEDRKPGMVG